MKNKKLLLVIDGHAVLHRAFHALPPLSTKKGELVNAVYGFLLIFLKAVKEFKPGFIAAVFDMPGATVRHKEFKGYKAKRPKTPQGLSQQIPKIKEILKAFDVPIFEKQGFEADDLIGAISLQTEKRQVFPRPEIIILTGDLDALQMVSSQTKVYAMRKGVKDAVLYDVKKVKERYEGLLPEQLLDFRGLRGDPSDNIPGVAGIGEKTAVRLLKDFDTLENLYEEIERGTDKAGGIRENIVKKLKGCKEQAFLSKKLAQIRRDVPVDFKIEDCRWGQYDKQKLIKVLENFEFYVLIKRLPGEETDKRQNLKLL